VVLIALFFCVPAGYSCRPSKTEKHQNNFPSHQSLSEINVHFDSNVSIYLRTVFARARWNLARMM